MSGPKFTKLCELYPKVFAIEPAKRRPLAIGIREALLAVDTGMTPDELKAALAQNCGTYGYLRRMREGQARIGLDGQCIGFVTADDARWSALNIANRAANQRMPIAATIMAAD